MNVEKIDKLVDSICDLMQEEIGQRDGMTVREMSEMVTALASLIETRAKIDVGNYIPSSGEVLLDSGGSL